MTRRLIVASLLIATGAGPALGATSVRRAAIGSAGVDLSATQHRVRSTLAQPVAAKAAATQHTVHSGFWWPGQFVSGAEGEEAMPLVFALRGISPNPFSRSTEIRYDVPAAGGPIAMQIYDVRGRRIRTLHQGHAPGGVHRLRWNGADDAGHRVGSGFYILKFSAPGRTVTQKLVLLP